MLLILEVIAPSIHISSFPKRIRSIVDLGGQPSCQDETIEETVTFKSGTIDDETIVRAFKNS